MSTQSVVHSLNLKAKWKLWRAQDDEHVKRDVQLLFVVNSFQCKSQKQNWGNPSSRFNHFKSLLKSIPIGPNIFRIFKDCLHNSKAKQIWIDRSFVDFYVIHCWCPFVWSTHGSSRFVELIRRIFKTDSYMLLKAATLIAWKMIKCKQLSIQLKQIMHDGIQRLIQWELPQNLIVFAQHSNNQLLLFGIHLW